ncbi:AcrR family transcriptional regulator [Kibdelosporangium banguiense]|uniref:AcrR family transcriptional regulator n=1 Tax=Kibdelosporangium banguiense TaxID=1365924 RepID=A0ABS4TS89_9PSEU|nr:TetR/AcrR family transcriptional regulator [Kibdelosporangium banguiense]MBP2326756.1 AcrR family transcriptional regulator [Kibdelosporangium banguiense]
MPRPRSLTTDQLADAALAVIDRDGLAGLTMRAVAKELGVSTMGLYRYVNDREELEHLVVERVLAAVDTTRPETDPIVTMVQRMRAAIRAHPEVMPLTATYRHNSPSVLRWSETVLEILAGAGIDGRSRVVAMRALLGYVIGAIQLDQRGPLTGAGTIAIAAQDEFPRMAETARYAREIGPDEEFAGGLAVLLRGLGLSDS